MTVRGANYPRKKNDHYPTPPEAIRALFDNVRLGPNIHDPACGPERRILKVARKYKLKATGSDITMGEDFLAHDGAVNYDLVTNPPYGDRGGRMSLHFIVQSLLLTRKHGRSVAMLLPVDFDSGKTRAHVFQHSAFACKLVLLDRVKWFNNQAGSLNHAWFIWRWKHKGPPILKYTRIYG